MVNLWVDMTDGVLGGVIDALGISGSRTLTRGFIQGQS